MTSKTCVDPSTLSGFSTGFDSLNDSLKDPLQDSPSDSSKNSTKGTLQGASNDFDGAPVVFTDSLDDNPLFAADWDQQETPPYDANLYSTPLSWDPPEPSRAEPIPPVQAFRTIDTLTPAQQEKLRNIAMPPHLRYQAGSSHSPESTPSYKSLSTSSPEPNDKSRKRKSSVSADEEDDDGAAKHPPVKKTAHNMIEKRYRTNLNDKIAALRDSVPSLRIMTKSARGEDTADDREELQGLTPAHKLNKATVLSKATEYINHLEKRNKRLQEENLVQKARLAAFETLFRSGSMGFAPAAPVTNPFQYPREYQTPGRTGTVDPQGMIRVPEDMRRLHGRSSQQTYPVAQEQFQQQQQRQPVGPNGWQNSGGYFGRLMVGSLAGLMIMEGFGETEKSGDSPSGRGLFSLPVQMLRSISQAARSSTDFSVLGYHVSAAQSLASIKLFLALGALLYVFLPSLFASSPRSKAKKAPGTSLAAVPSLASSIQVRRQAWLTAIQTVWVPRHNFFLEAAALCLKMVKLSMRNVIGPDGYAYLTGITPQEEAARIKAWEIALDAQLAGGDVEVSKSRLTLTLLASGMLPDTPARLMLKALHIRVLLWEVGNAGFNGFSMFHDVAAKLARWKWNEAKQLRRLIAQTGDKQEAEFPAYLAVLLEEDCDDVLTDNITQRAYNLAWNLPTVHNVHGPRDGMDGVIDDFAIRSPLDGLAAWYSSMVLQRILSRSLSPKSDADSEDSTASDIELAIKVAPTGSGAHIRALVARAVLIKEKRGANISSALQALGPSASKDEKKTTPATLINTRTCTTNLPDVNMSLRCAMAIAHLERFPSPQNPVATHRIIQSVVPRNLTLLGFTAAFNLMERIYEHEEVALSCSSALEKLAGNLRIWIGGPGSEESALDKEATRHIIERCLSITKRIIGIGEDAGYESMSDDDISDGC